MQERDVEIATADGRMPVFITAPEHDAPHATVIVYMDGPGIREELRDMARRIGTVGYYVMLPNLFYRDGGPSFDPALLATQGPDPEMDRLNRALSISMVLSDTRSLVEFAAADPAAREPIGTIGYCMGGRHAYAAAGTFPDRVAALASLHAGFQVTDSADSAHLLTSRVKASCYFGFADGDPLTPPEHQHAIADACRRHGVDTVLETFAGTGHGFTLLWLTCTTGRRSRPSTVEPGPIGCRQSAPRTRHHQGSSATRPSTCSEWTRAPENTNDQPHRSASVR